MCIDNKILNVILYKKTEKIYSIKLPLGLKIIIVIPYF